MRYVLHPGWVESAHDQDRHYISANRLARLYGLNLYDENATVFRRGYLSRDADIHLYPNYVLPEQKPSKP